MKSLPTAKVHSFVLCLAAIFLLGVVAQAAGTSLLSSTVPGTYEIRYWTDRALVSYMVETPEDAAEDTFTLSIALPEPVKWVFIDKERADDDVFSWKSDSSQAALTLPRGDHSLQVGWAGEAGLPPDDVTIPVEFEGKTVGHLQADFSLDGMKAFGNAALGEIGRYRVRLYLEEDISRDAVELAVGSESINRWSKAAGVMVSRNPLIAGASAPLSLRVNKDNLMSSPVKSIELEQVGTLSHAVVVEEKPENGIMVEAEDYDNNRGSNFQINPGSHFDTSGGSCIYSFKGDGTWIEWDFEVPEAGKYDLYARITLGNPQSYRRVEVSGQTRPDLSVIEIPGTGGWGHAPGEWQVMKLAGTKDTPALDLQAGTVTVRMTGILESDMNMDWLMLVPHQ